MFIVFTITFLLLFVAGMRYMPCGHAGYVGKEQANAIKGFFILYLTIGHITGELMGHGLYPDGFWNHVDEFSHSAMNSLVVVMFLFFSGFGVAEGLKRGAGDQVVNMGYVRSMPRRRVLNTLLNFGVVVVIYLLCSPLTGRTIEWSQLPLYFLALKSAGNSSWYIFVILTCYVVTWLSTSLVHRTRGQVVAMHTLLTAVAAVALYVFKGEREYYWYTTIMAYAFGFAYSQYKAEFEAVISKRWLLSLVFTAVMFVAHYIAVQKSGLPRLVTYNLLSMWFALLFVIMGMRFRVGNKAINWCGSHLFPIYMYQGLFYLALLQIGGERHTFVSWSPFLYALATLVLTLIIAKFFHLWEINVKSQGYLLTPL